MKEKSVQESTAKLLVHSGAVNSVTVVRISDRPKKQFFVKLQVGSDEISVASKREAVRTWSSLDTVATWLQEIGISDAALKIV
jgi:hypothetical protein